MWESESQFRPGLSQKGESNADDALYSTSSTDQGSLRRYVASPWWIVYPYGYDG